ncbi:MAG: hypothetical protein H0U72_08145 [Nitrosospira sp.]|nr:hypothetical protein [Nitrosospira sp.]
MTLRREREPVFRDGDYLPLKVHGEHGEQVVAFTRHLGEETLLVAAPRLFGGLTGDHGKPPVGEAAWGDTWIKVPPERVHERWTNALMDETFDTQARGEAQGLSLAQLFGTFPYALLQVQRGTATKI